jgi:hypothetical protein
MYLFFVRHFNDIDHITPVAWKMHTTKHPVAVYCMNPRYEVDGDYRLRFLRDLGVSVNDLHREFDRNRGRMHAFLTALMNAGYDAEKRTGYLKQGRTALVTRFAPVCFGLLGTLFYKVTRSLFYRRKWARAILEKTGARAVCFDHIMPQRFVVNAFLRAADQMSIPALSLPHGILLYTNENTKPKSTQSRRRSKFGRFDYILVPNRLRKDLLVKTGIAEDKITVLGSARYCREWLDQNRKIIPRSIAEKQDFSGKLKVVFMESKPQCRVDSARMKTTYASLAEMSDVRIMIKPHTRSAEGRHLFDKTRLADASGILTAELCEWADAMLVVGSSVVTEALMQGKPALYLKYLHRNRTLFEDLGACWSVSDEQELRKALSALQANPQTVPYDKARVLDYLTDVVYGGDGRRDVLAAYQEFIVGCASSRAPHQGVSQL